MARRTAEQIKEALAATPLGRLLVEAQQSETLKAALRFSSQSANVWRGMFAVPPNTLMEAILADFKQGSDIPLEMPFFYVFSVLSGYLLQKGITINYEGNIVTPDIWLIVLSPSGAGKTKTFQYITQHDIKELKDSRFNLTGIQSDAGFFELMKLHNRKLGVRDEWNEFYKRTKIKGDLLNRVRDYLLQAYDNEPLERVTLKEGHQVLEDIQISILGMTVKESFCSSLAADDLVNGFAQRFLYVIARDDPARPFVNYPVYKIFPERWLNLWHKTIDSIKFKQYIAGQDAISEYEQTFRILFNEEMDKSFYKRIIWTTHKYALLYHILTGHGDEEVVRASSYGWAARALTMHLCDLGELMETSTESPLQKLVMKGKHVISHLRATGRPVTARALVQNVRDIKSVGEARALLALLSEPEDKPNKTDKLPDKV